MKIIINTAHQRFGGAIQVALSFIYECRNFHEHEYYIWIGQGIRKLIDEQDFPINFHFYHFDFGVITFFKTIRISHTLKKLEKKIKPDCIISTSGPTYIHSNAPQIIGYNLPLYIYPESPFLKSLSKYRTLRLNLKRVLHFYFFKRDATAYIVQTDDVNERVRKALKTERVYTVNNTHNSYYNNWKKYPPRLLTKHEGQVRLITVSAYYPHKNLEIIPQVLNELKQRGRTNIQFVLTLSQDDFKNKIGIESDGIVNVGPVKPAECPSLYDECDIMFLPTLAECFSASYPEAMVMGKPIITSNLGFTRSICDEAALYFEPKNPLAAADAIEKLLNDNTLWEDLVNNGNEKLKAFDTPASRAKKYLELCHQLTQG